MNTKMDPSVFNMPSLSLDLELKTLHAKAKQDHYCSRLEKCNTTKEMTQVTSELFPSNDELIVPPSMDMSEIPSKFSDFFAQKIHDIRDVLDQHNTISPSFSVFNGSVFNGFQKVDDTLIQKIISEQPTKVCALDPLPKPLLIACMDELTPLFTAIINESLSTGIVPNSFKHALLTPLLKKQGLDPDILKNYRPVSNLSFLSKLLERVVLTQLSSHLQKNGLLDIFQSAYKKNNSTETALLYVVNELLLNADAKQISVLALLDLSAAFDTLDHDILLKRLEISFGISGTVLKWFASYLESRSQQVCVSGNLSTPTNLIFGVPQGSVLGPVLFTLYIQPLSDVISAYNVKHQKYADDTQLLDSAAPTNMNPLTQNMENCIASVKEWMDSNKLKLNGDKTELLVSGTKHFLSTLEQPPSLSIDNTIIQPAPIVKNLGVFLDPILSLKEHISFKCKTANYNIRNIAFIRHCLTFSAAVQLVSTLVLSHLDYCNALLSDLPAEDIARLQVVQNNAARVIFRKSKRSHVTQLLIRLHWLPVRYRIRYKIATLAYRMFDNTLPQCLARLLKIKGKEAPRSDKNASTARVTRSSKERLLVPPKIPRTSTYGERAFNAQAPMVWNALPNSVRNSPSMEAFKSRLKTYLFTLVLRDADLQD